MHENWIEAIRYLNVERLRERKKDLLRQIGEAARSPRLLTRVASGWVAWAQLIAVASSQAYSTGQTSSGWPVLFPTATIDVR